jgi:hypothetical protein
MSPVIGPPGWVRPEPGTKIPLGSAPALDGEALAAVYSPAAGEIRVADELEGYMAGAVKAASERLKPSETGMVQRQSGQLPPSQRLQQEQAAAPAPDAAELQRLLDADLSTADPKLLRQLDDKIGQVRASRNLYSEKELYGDPNDDADVDEFEHVEVEQGSWFGEADMPGDYGYDEAA